MFKFLKSPLESTQRRNHSGGHKYIAPCFDPKWLSLTRLSEMLGLPGRLLLLLDVQAPRGSIPMEDTVASCR